MAKPQACPMPCPDTGNIRRRQPKEFTGATLTEASHKAACDINNIMARYVKSGTLDHVNQYEGQYLDCPPDDYHSAMSKIAEANSMFAELPSRMRYHFANDPAEFLKFCSETDNASDALMAIAEEYRKQALGIDVSQTEQQETTPSGMDAATGEAAKAGDGPPDEATA